MNSKHSSLHTISSHWKMAVAGFGLFLGHRLCYDMSVVLAALHVLRLGEQMSLMKMLVDVLVCLDSLLVRMLGAVLGRLNILRGYGASVGGSLCGTSKTYVR